VRAARPRATARPVEGVIESANDHGIKVAGEWHNLSKFHPIDLPDRGARVRVSLDAKAFIRSIEVLDGAPSPTSGSSSSPTTRDRTITRLAVLKAASNFLGLMGQTREDVKSDHVIVLADRWLAWVEQTDDREEGEQF
jgi:hypothetical protein